MATRTSRASRREQKPDEKKEYAPRGQPPIAPKTFSVPSFREAVRCARCGNELTIASAWSPDARCPRCGADLHAARSAQLRYRRAVRVPQADTCRVSPKDARNSCTLFEPRTTVERETKTAAPANARQAFDDLFK